MPIVPRNFTTEPLRRPEAEDIFKTIRLGVKGTPKVATEGLSDDETWNLVAYILHPRQPGR